MSITYTIYCRSVLLTLLLSILIPYYSISQADYYTLPDHKTSDLREIVKYENTKKALVPKEFEEEEKEEKKNREIQKSDWGGLGSTLTYISYLAIIILVIVILILLFSNIKIEKKIEDIQPLALEDIEDIETIDAKSGLELALEANNYREAVRMLFIQLLQVLVIEKSIIWKPKKTNRNYLNEMSTHDKVAHFRNLVMAYERVWYGSQSIDRMFFDSIKKDFDKFYSTTDLKLNHGE